MILCKKAEGTDGYFVQAEGGEREVTLEALHILRAVYDHCDTAAGKTRFRCVITEAVTGEDEWSIWGTPVEQTSIDLSPLHRWGKLQREEEEQ